MDRYALMAEKGRAFLGSSSADERESLRKELAKFDGDFGRVVERMKPKRPAKAETGFIKNRPFRVEKFQKKYPGEIMTLYVPESYDPGKPTGLLIFLHGGGQCQPRDSGLKIFDEGYAISDLLMESGLLVCAPCCPYSETSFNGWNLPEVDDLVADVIEEMEHFYAIDPDRVFLAGSSMGGIGTLHLAHRMADRFAGCLASASAWDMAFWPCLTGTTLWFLQGINDAVMFRRRHGTDIEFARLAKMRLEQFGVDCVYREHTGGHPIGDGRWIFRDFLRWAAGHRRDPFFPHVVAVTPRGLTPWMEWRRHKVPLASYQNHLDFHDLPPAPHARWVTVDGVGRETILYDIVEMNDVRDAVEEDWNRFSLTLRRKHIRGGVLEAVQVDRGLIEATPKNVEQFTLWLRPDRVNFRNLRVVVKGTERFRGAVRPDLGTLVESYRRRRDWGLLYPASITIEKGKFWETSDQLKLGLHNT